MTSSTIPFSQRPKSARERARERVLAECVDITLTKVDRRRRYWIRPGKAEGEWYCQVWFGDSQHRGDITDYWQKVHRLKAEYSREMDELELDGWRIIAGTDSHSNLPNR